jgi:hypothetical protein
MYRVLFEGTNNSIFLVPPACYLLHAGFLLDLFIDPEDGGEMFLRNVG